MAKPVYALVGADSFLQLEALSRILHELPKDVDRVDVDGERAQPAEVFDDLRSFAMFGGGKVVVMRNADAFVSDHREVLESYLASPSTSSTFVMRFNSLDKRLRVYKLISQMGQIELCDPPKNAMAWIMSRARNVHRVNVAPDAARLLEELIGQDMGRLDSELAKLALAAPGNQIDAALVQKNVSFQAEQEMWSMTDELSRGQAADAVRRWGRLVQLDSSAEFRAVTWLGIWLEKVQSALNMAGKGTNWSAIFQDLRIWPTAIQGSFKSTATSLGSDGVARAVDLLAEADYQSKTGVGNAVDNVERFILSLGSMISARG